MPKVTNFEQLDCWKSSRELVNLILDICDKTDMKFQFRFREQLVSASLSVMNNIAEGFSRFSRTEFVRFLNISVSSCCEVKSMSYILLDRQLISNAEFDTLQNTLSKTNYQTSALIKYLISK